MTSWDTQANLSARRMLTLGSFRRGAEREWSIRTNGLLRHPSGEVYKKDDAYLHFLALPDTTEWAVLANTCAEHLYHLALEELHKDITYSKRITDPHMPF